MASASYARRNAAARLLGYRNYYDYRVHNHGRIPASVPAPTGEARSRLRGHRGRADFEQAVGAGSLVSVQSTERGADGKLTKVTLLLIGEDGRSRVYVLRGKALKSDQLKSLVKHSENSGAVFSPSPSLDVRRIQQEIAEEQAEQAEQADYLEEEGEE